MEKITSIKNEDFGEIRIGIDDNYPAEAYVSLALNHIENDKQWGGQPLAPELARHIGCMLIEYAAKADEIQNEALKKVAPF